MKILLTITVIILTQCSAHSQNKKISNPYLPGAVMTIGGSAMTIGGFLTPADKMWVNSQNGYYNPATKTKGSFVTQPFYKQGPRFYDICIGCTVTITGAITLITSKKR